MSAAEAVRLAELMANGITETAQVIERQLPAARGFFSAWLRQTLHGEPFKIREDQWATLSRQSEAVRQEVTFTAADIGTIALWSIGKVVYDFHPELWASLRDLPVDTRIPADLWTYLPHPNPFVWFPEPVDVSLPGGGFYRVNGFFVFGRIDRAGQRLDDMPVRISSESHSRTAVQVSSDHPDATSIGVLIGAQSYGPDGKIMRSEEGELDTVWTRFTLDPRDGTLSRMVDACTANYVQIDDMGDWREHVTILLPVVVKALFWLCNENRDLKPVGTPPLKKGHRRVKRPDAARAIHVGYRVGSQLKMWREETAQRAQRGEPGTGGKKAPHIRRAHPHIYWTGKGRKTLTIKFARAARVNMGDRSVPVPVAYRVPKKPGAGSRASAGRG